jgi:hypothetical protein
MRIIPTSVVALLLLASSDEARRIARKEQSQPMISSSSLFTCNEPFMIPAQYIDLQGNSFAMCLSDPKFHRNRLIWYIQELNGPYKAIGVAAKQHGSGRFKGTVLPIEQPDNRSGMHADPVRVSVHLDRSSGVISIKPVGDARNVINWTIKPRGFPPGTLKVPTSCGPFLKTLKDPKLIAPLTGAGRSARVCIAHGHGADAFISWGSSAHPGGQLSRGQDDDALGLEGDAEKSFFSLGFVGSDRGVSIDICDGGDDDGVAQRCEMSRLVGHVRKTFIVGDEDTYKVNVGDKSPVKACDLNKKIHKSHKMNKYRKHHMHKHGKHHMHKHHKTHMHHKAHVHKHHKHPRHHHHKHPRHHHLRHHHNHHKQADLVDLDHESRSNALVAKINMIERNIQSILKRSDTPVTPRPVHHRRRRKSIRRNVGNEDLSDLEDVIGHADLTDLEDEDFYHKRPRGALIRHQKIHHHHPRRHHHVKQHRVKQCSVQHPLLHPPQKIRQTRPIRPIRPISPPRNNHIQEEEALIGRFNRLNQRLDEVEDEINGTESFVSRKLEAFNDWLNEQKEAWELRAKEFTNFLRQLKENIVYTPKKGESNFISGFGKTLRGTDPEIDTGIVPEKKSNSIFSPFKKAFKSIDNHIVKPGVGAVSGTVHGVTSGTGKLVSGTVNGVSDGVNGISSGVGNTINGSVDLVDGTTRSTLRTAKRTTNGIARNSDRFDFNDDLIESPRESPRKFDSHPRLARSPGIKEAAANPLGPGGPVLPPPAKRTFHHHRREQEQESSVRAAYDYLN